MKRIRNESRRVKRWNEKLKQIRRKRKQRKCVMRCKIGDTEIGKGRSNLSLSLSLSLRPPSVSQSVDIVALTGFIFRDVLDCKVA